MTVRLASMSYTSRDGNPQTEELMKILDVQFHELRVGQ